MHRDRCMRIPLGISLVLAACGGSAGSRAISIKSDQVSAANNKCGAYAIRTGEVTADGEAVRLWMPCWDFTKDSARYQVPANRAMAARLSAIEKTQCIGLAPAALERSPFVQDNAIDEIVPHRSGSEIRGAHIVFKPIPGLTVSWMRRAIACHQARWRTLGKPVSYLAGDPTLIDGAEINVTENGDHIVVLIASEAPGAAQIALDRAQDLKASMTARR
jgi:hypothetical protein